MTKNSSPSGTCHFQAAMILVPGATQEILGIRCEGEDYVDLVSVAACFRKSLVHVRRLCIDLSLPLVRFPRGNGLVERVVAIKSDDFIKLAMYEGGSLDNPYAKAIADDCGKIGFLREIDAAAAAGLDYVETPNGRISFRRNQCGEMEVDLASMAKVIGIDPSEVAELFKSSDFSRHMADQSFMRKQLGIPDPKASIDR